LALDGRRLMWGHNNQPKVGVDSGRGVGEETDRGGTCRGGCLFIPGGELNEIKIMKKNVFALDGRRSNTTTNQKHEHATQEVRKVRRLDQ